MPLVDLAAVRAHVLAHAPVLGAVDVDVTNALGLVAGAAVIAEEASPPFANSAMDGFAVRAADVVNVPAHLDVIATIGAGADPSAITVGPGQAARIMTGAAMPSGADAVVMIEETDGGADGAVEIRRSVGPGDFVRGPGEDVRAGDIVIAAGDVLAPARIGLAAAVGCARLKAIPAPRVAVLSTGDELAPPGAPLRHGQIRDSNRLLLRGLVVDAGYVAVDFGVVTDDRAAIAAALQEAVATCDAVITSGGVSVGDFDFLAPVIGELGEVSTWQIAIKPAKPFVFGTIRGIPVFALPGNPVSTAVSFELLARPALRQMAGHPAERLDRPRVRAIADDAFARGRDGKTHFVRVATSWDGGGRLHVRSAGGQGSHVLSALASAGGLAVLPDGDGIAGGDEIDVLLFA